MANTITIRAKKDLYNQGKCFTKNREYTFDTSRNIVNTYSLMEVMITNDLGEPHLIGHWHKDFDIIEDEE